MSSSPSPMSHGSDMLVLSGDSAARIGSPSPMSHRNGTIVLSDAPAGLIGFYELTPCKIDESRTGFFTDDSRCCGDSSEKGNWRSFIDCLYN